MGYIGISSAMSQAIVVVSFINISVLLATYILFRFLRSTATYRTKKWTAGGALAGFLIVTGLQLYLIEHFFGTQDQNRDSYAVVDDFYRHLQNQRYDAAWQLLTKKFQMEVWNGDKQYFVDGYRDTIALHLLAIKLELAGSAVSDNYIVYYVDEVKAWVLPGLQALGSRRIKELKNIISAVDELRDTLQRGGYNVDNFDNNITIGDLMAPNRSIRLSWKLGHASGEENPPPETFNKLFKNRENKQFISAVRVFTQKTDMGWKISGLNGIRFED